MVIKDLLTENMTAVRNVLQSVKLSCRVFVCMLFLFYFFLSFSWYPLSTLSFAEAADPEPFIESVYVTQESPTKDTDTASVTKKTTIEDNGSESVLWRFTKRYELSPMFTPEVDMVTKENRASYDTFLERNLPSDARDRQLHILNLKQHLGDFSYGAEYRHVGKSAKRFEDYKKSIRGHYKLQSDQEGLEVWAAKKFGSIHCKGFFSRFWDNVDGNPRHYQMLTIQTGVAADYKIPSLPIYLSFSYSRGESASTTEPYNSRAKGSSRETYDGSIYYYGGDKFDVTLSSAYSPSVDRYDSEKETESYWHEFSASFRPTWNITITPTVSYGEDRYLWYGGRIEMPSASLSIGYSQLFDVIDFSLWGSFSRMKGSDGYLDETTLDSWVEINWSMEDLLSSEVKCALEVGYQQHIDNIYPDGSYDALSASISFKLPF
jgi:hypothetical protein